MKHQEWQYIVCVFLNCQQFSTAELLHDCRDRCQKEVLNKQHKYSPFMSWINWYVLFMNLFLNFLDKNN